MDVLDSLLDVEGVSDSSSDDLELESVGLLLLLVLGVVAGEIEGEVEVVLVESAVGGKMRGLLMADRQETMSLSDGNNDDNGLVMRLFGVLVFVVDGPVMVVFL